MLEVYATVCTLKDALLALISCSVEIHPRKCACYGEVGPYWEIVGNPLETCCNILYRDDVMEDHGFAMSSRIVRYFNSRGLRQLQKLFFVMEDFCGRNILRIELHLREWSLSFM